MSKFVIPKISTTAAQAQLGWPVVQIKESHDLALAVDDLGAEGALAVVPVFDGMQAGDSLTLRWQGYYNDAPEDQWTKTISLSDADLQRPVQMYIEPNQIWFIDEGYAEVCFELSSTARLQAGVSPVQTLQIIAPVSQRLAAPAVEGHDAGRPLDPDRFPEGVVLKIVGYPGMQLDDDVVLYADGTPDEGSVVMSLRIDSSHLQAGAIEFSIGPAWLLANQGAQVSVIYQYARPGVAKTSTPLELSVLEPQELLPPIVEKAEAEGQAGEYRGYLLASDALAGVYVNVPPALQLEPGDELEVHWDGHPAGGQHVAPAPADPADKKRFFIPPTAVAANMGSESKRFEVRYGLTPVNATGRDSQAFNLHIRPLAQSGYPVIQWPRLAGATTLRLSQVASNGESVELGPWPFMAQGQLVTIEVTGVSVTGGPTGIYVRDGQPVSQAEVMAEKLEAKVPLPFLRSLKIDEYITLNVRASFDGGQTPTHFGSNGGVRLVS